MGSVACNQGCFVCGPHGQRLGHINTGCCGSTICDEPRWQRQTEQWLTIEQVYNDKVREWLRAEEQYVVAWLYAEQDYQTDVTGWLEAESEWITQVRAKATKPPVRRVRADEIDPAHQRRAVKATAAKVRVRQR